MGIGVRKRSKNVTGFLAACTACFCMFSFTAYADTAETESLLFREGKYIELEKALDKIPGTMDFKVNLKSGQNSRQILFGNYDSGKEACFSIELTSGGELRYYENVYEGGYSKGAVYVTSDTPVATGQWVQLSVVRNPDTDRITLYQDGKIIKEEQTSIDIKADVPMSKKHFIGTDYRKSYFAKGKIAQVSLWEKVKTSDQILQDMDVDLSGEEEGLFQCWKLSEAALAEMKVKNLKKGGIDGKLVGIEAVYEKKGTNFSSGISRIEMEEKLSAPPLTVEAWVKMPASSSRQRGGVICGNYFQKYYTDIPLFNFEIYENGHPRIYYSVNDKSYEFIDNGVNVCTDEWTHLAMSYDPQKKEMACYVNGTLSGKTSVVFTPEKMDQPLAIGRDSRDNMNLKGELADLRIWSTTRTEEEIKANFNSELTGSEEGLMAGYRLDESVDGVFSDYSKNGIQVSDAWFEGEIAEGDYRIAVIPDTQNLTSNYYEKLTAMTNWIKDQSGALNIGLAVQVGDLVNGNGNQWEWDRIKAGMSILDGFVPYVFVPGNHDTNTRDTTMFNKNFPSAKYTAAESFGGAYEEGKMDNTYSYFLLGDVEYMTLAMEPAPRAEVIAWANEVAEENQDKKIIVVTHIYLNHDGNRTNSESQDQPNYLNDAFTGDEIWDEFASRHENIVMVLSGHVGYPDLAVREDTGVHGNKVQQVLCDAQFFDSEMGGLGMVMLMTFHEGSDEVDINWYSTDKNKLFRKKNQLSVSLQLTDQGENPSDNADLTTLKLAIMMAEKMEKEQNDNKCYTEASWAAAEEVLNQARVLLEKEGATQAEVDEVFLNLITSCNLVESGVQKVGLKAAIEGAKAILSNADSLTLYQEASIEAVREAIRIAEQTYSSASTDQTAINQSASNLMTAVTSMLVKEDNTRLGILIQKAEELLKKKEQYTTSSIDSLTVVLDAARAVAGKGQATGAEISEAYEKLAEAMTSLVRKANKDELKNALEQAEKILDESDKYLESSIQGLQEVMDASNGVYDDEEADTTAVGEALKKLIREILEARLMGDVDLNGTVDTQDAAKLLKANAELEELTEEQYKVGDVNKDGISDSSDATAILQYASEKVEVF